MMKVGDLALLSLVSAAWSEQQSIFVRSCVPFFNRIVFRPWCDSGVHCAIPFWLSVLHPCSFYAKI